jgi:uncharacterized membrane protein YecN with MAPEG domain
MIVVITLLRSSASQALSRPKVVSAKYAGMKASYFMNLSWIVVYASFKDRKRLSLMKDEEILDRERGC